MRYPEAFHKVIKQEWTLALVWVAIFFVCYVRIDPDFGWHLQSGAYILANGVPTHDIFTYTAGDFRWINHEWLNDVFVRITMNIGGYGFLAALIASLWTLALRMASGRALPLFISGIAYAAWLPYLGVRPITWTVLGLGMLLAVLRVSDKRWLWIIPLLFMAWGNLHGGFVVGLGLLGITAIVRRSKQLGYITGLSILATLINPYGVQVYVEILRTVGDHNLAASVMEWAPLALGYSVLPYLMAAIFALWYVAADRSVKLLSWLLLGAGVAATRQLPLFVVASIGVVTTGYESLVCGLKRKALVQVVLAGVGLSFMVVVLVWPASSSGQRFTVPTRVLAALKGAPCSGNLFNNYSYGGAIIRELSGVKVYIDGRMPSWTGPEGRYLDRWERVMEGGSYTDSEFKRYNVQCVLIKQTDIRLAAYLKHRGWREDVAAEGASLWRKYY